MDGRRTYEGGFPSYKVPRSARLRGAKKFQPLFTIGCSKAVLHGLSMFAVKAKIYGVLYNQASSIAFDETSSYWSALKAPDFSAFHWSPRGNLVSIGQHFVITRVVHLPKRTETSLITESDRVGPIR